MRTCCAGNSGRSLVFQVATNSPDSVVLYLACLEASCPVCLLDPRATDRLQPLLQVYRPGAVLLPREAELPAGCRAAAPPHGRYLPAGALPHVNRLRRPLHPDLALLLTTSGSTGSPKLVRLTTDNVLANAKSIAAVSRNSTWRTVCSKPADVLFLRAFSRSIRTWWLVRPPY